MNKITTLALAISGTTLYFPLSVIASESDINAYIIGGNEVSVAPSDNFMASLRINEGDKKPFCGATVIDDNWILTAAHCVVYEVQTTSSDNKYDVLKPSQVMVTAGITDNIQYTAEDEYQASHVVVHPSYSPEVQFKKDNKENITEITSAFLDNDVALIRVERTFSNVGRVQIPSSVKANELDKQLTLQWNNDNREPNLVIKGWGATTISGDNPSDYLQEARLTSYPIQECYQYYSDGGFEGQFIDNPASLLKICSLPPKLLSRVPIASGADACFGDSGGPIMTQSNNGDWYQIGIVSGSAVTQGLACGSYSNPTFYARTGTFSDWIAKITNTVPEQPVIYPNFISEQKNKITRACNDSISANNCNITEDDGGSGGYVGILSLTLLGMMAYFRRKKS